MPEAFSPLPVIPCRCACNIVLGPRNFGRRRKHDAGEFMARIVARRLVKHLRRAGFAVMKKPPAAGASALGRGYEGRQTRRRGSPPS